MSMIFRKLLIYRFSAATLILTGLLCIQSCGKYEQVTDKFDFLKFEYFTCDAVSVTDAERFVCRTPGMDMQKIKLTGISVPEEKEAAAKKFSESVLRRGTLVRVEPDKNQKIDAGNIPAYVFVPGGKMLNVLLLENGNAVLVKSEVSEKYMKQFEEAAKKAASEKSESKDKQPWLR